MSDGSTTALQRSAAGARGPAGVVAQVGGDLLGAERLKVDAYQFRESGGDRATRSQGSPVLVGAARQDHVAAVRQGLVDAVQGQRPHGGRQFVESVEHRQDQPPLQQHGSQGDLPEGIGGASPQFRVVLHESALHPGAQVQYGRIPGGQREQHGYRIVGRASFDQRQHESHQQQGLARPGLAEDQQTPGRDAPREDVDDLVAPACEPLRVAGLGQNGVGVTPGNGQWVRGRQPHGRLGLPLPSHRVGQPVGDLGGAAGHDRLAPVGPVGAPGQVGTGPRRQQCREHGGRVLHPPGDQERPHRAHGQQGQVHHPGAPHACTGDNTAHATSVAYVGTRMRLISASATRVGERRGGEGSCPGGLLRSLPGGAAGWLSGREV